MIFLPPTTVFPRDPELLRQEDLKSTYLELRSCYKSAMISRGQYRRRANKAREETNVLRQNLLDLAAREASVRTDIYQMLEIVTAIAGDLEDAGDGIVTEFGRYKLGRNTARGGSLIGGLVQAVIRFINRWSRTKERVVQLDQKRQALIEKTRDLPPLPLSISNATEPAQGLVIAAREVTADGTTH
jgi:hypothetical protein